MNVAILETNEISQAVAHFIATTYNPWLEKIGKVPLNVVAYTIGGQNNTPPTCLMSKAHLF